MPANGNFQVVSFFLALNVVLAVEQDAHNTSRRKTEQLRMISRRTGAILLVLLTLLIITAAILATRVAQPLSYHQFADTRSWLTIPNFGDVASNLLFAIFGAWGLWSLATNRSSRTFLDHRERWPYITLFLGIFLTAFGSGYYHLMPNNSRLVWDRLPMTIAFMSLVSALIAERIDVTLGVRLLVPLLCVGILSVLHWHFSEERGEGDLRFYAAVQVYAIAVLLLLLLLPPRYTRTSDLIWVGVCYLLAKALETADRTIFSFGHFVSGHTLKHLAAGMSGYFLLHMLQKREPATLQAQPSYVP
jgi:hypothetical protein